MSSTSADVITTTIKNKTKPKNKKTLPMLAISVFRRQVTIESWSYENYKRRPFACII